MIAITQQQRFLPMLVAMLFAASCFAQEHQHHATHAAKKVTSGQSMPFVRLTDDGRLHMVYVDEKEGVKTIRYRQGVGDSAFESAVTAPGASLSHWPESPPQLEVTRDGAIHVIYSVRTGGAEGEDAAPIELRLATSTDGGRTWVPYRVIGEPENRVYRACVSMREDGQGGLVFSWLEGHAGQDAIGVKTAVLHDDKVDYAFADEKACECCGTELVRANDGTMWLGYRDVDENSVRDMCLARMTPDVNRFGPPARISRDRWMVPGCPDTGPRFALSGEDQVWVAWYSGNPRGVYAANATNTAPKFSNRELVQGADDHVFSMAHPAIGTLPGGRVLVVYECKRDGVDCIEGRLHDGSGWGAPIALGGAGEYPRIAANAQTAYLVYTAMAETGKSIAVRDLAETIPPTN